MNVVAEQRTSGLPLGRRDVRRRRRIGAVSALLAVIVSSWSHLRGGGSTDGIVAIVPLLVSAPLVGAVVGCRRWSFGAIVAALVALQPAVHVAMSRSMSDSMSRHGARMDGSSMAMMHDSVDPRAMVVMHAAAVVASAVMVRCGWRWLSTMPFAVAAAIAPRRISTSWPLSVVTMLERACFRAPTAPCSTARWSRGPPR